MDDREQGGLADLQRQLSEIGAPVEVTAGHRDIGPGLWLSSDPGGQAHLAIAPSEAGFVVRLEKGDSGAWACLGMLIAPEALKPARYLGLLAVRAGGATVSFSPTLRYFQGDRIHDTPADMPMILAGAGREYLAHIPLDRERLETASGCELNLFFHTDGFETELSRIEPVLIL